MSIVQQAGPLGTVILGVAGLALVVALVFTGLAISKRRVPLALWALLPIVVAVLGGIGTYMGVGDAVEAVANANPNARMAMAMTGMADALGADRLGRWAGSILFALSAWGAGLGATIAAGPKEDRRWTAGTAILAGLLTVLGAVGVGVYVWYHELGTPGYAIAGVLAFGGIGVAVGSVRRALEEHAFRVAAMRFTSAMCLLFSVSYAGYAAGIGARIHLYQSAASGSEEAIQAAITMGSALDTAAWIAWGAAVLVALAGFLSEMGDVVQKGTLIDVVVTLLLMAALGGVRYVERAEVASLQQLAELSPVADVLSRGIGWPGAADVTPSSLFVGDEEVFVKPMDAFFGDVVVWKKDHWVRTHAWSGGQWKLDGDIEGTPVDEVTLNTDQTVLLVIGSGDPANKVFEFVEAHPEAEAALLLRAVPEMSSDAPPATVPLKVTMLPLELKTRPVDPQSQLWLSAHNQQVYVGPVRYWGEESGNRKEMALVIDKALEAHGGEGVHAILNERARVKDIADSWLAVKYQVEGDGVTRSGKWVNLVPADTDEIWKQAAEGYEGIEAEGLEIADVRVLEGELPQERTAKLFDWEAPALASCAEEFKDSDERGRFEAEFSVTRRGNAHDFKELQRNQVQSQLLWECVMGRIERMRFPETESEDGSLVELKMVYQ